MSESGKNSTIVRNTTFLYVRMFFLLLIGLYTNRVILDSLGVMDYGVYSAVAGVVGMLAFLSTALSGATSRFLSVEMGKSDELSLSKTFIASLTLHLCLILIIVLIFETIGMWYACNKLVVTPNRIEMVPTIFHISVATCALQILTAPFNASIISHEKMSVFAIVGIIDAILKLVISFAIKYSESDRLVLYSFLIFCVSLVNLLIDIIFCKYNFKECKFGISFDKKYLIPIASYFGWDVYGNFSVVVRNQGLVLIQNKFFGVILNAATTVSNNVMTAVMGFSENFLTAVRPQIFKNYAIGKFDRFNALVACSSKYGFLLLFIVSFPILVEADFILDLWLVDVPDYAAVFCKLALINNWVSIIFRPIVYGVNATGNVKNISLVNGTIYLMVLPLSYIMLRAGGSPIVPFVLNIVLLIIGHVCCSLRIIKKQIPAFDLSYFTRESLIPSFAVIVLSSIFPLTFRLFDAGGWKFSLINIAGTIICTGCICYFIGLRISEREKIKRIVLKKLIK